MSAAEDVADLGPQDIDSDSDVGARDENDRGTAEDAPQLVSPSTPPRRTATNGMSPEGVRADGEDDDATPLGSPAEGRLSSADGSVSTPDDSPSKQGSLLSSPRRRSRISSPNPSLRPFDRRFQARASLSPKITSRQSSASYFGHKPRQPSVLSTYTPSEGVSDSGDTPWEVVRWTKLRRITGEAFSEPGRRSFGRPTCIAVSSVIALGTSRGIVLVFDYNQNLQAIIGLGTKAAESGAVTAIALSADHSTVAAGHARGSIFTWEIAKPGKPFLYIPATNIAHVQDAKYDGHVEDVAVLHVGFLGTRHTALVSGDDRGMAFSHLATRGMGAIGRSVHTTRILGRYPELNATKPRKPSSVLAFSSLPLGNVESATDAIGLVAMLTPYLLVIVSTTPIAQTQHKAARPKELAAHGALSAALAWYPSMKIKTSQTPTNAKLAYSWLNVLTILEVIEVAPSEASDKERPPEFQFKFRKRWTAQESIVAVQWLGRSALAVVTITQRLLILDDTTLEVADSVDLLGKNIYHADFFSEQLTPLIEKLDEENEQMHGVVADAFYMSFRAYKGRLFMLGFNDMMIGTRSNWADRLIALMEHGDFIASIRLATSFYKGAGNHTTVGLPDNDQARQALVIDKLTEMISASLRYAFGQNAAAGEHRVSDQQLEELARACFAACLEVKDMDLLFEEVFSWYHECEATEIFLRLLEDYVLEEEITTVPPEVLKAMVSDYVRRGQSTQLEELICRLSPETMDLDQVTSLCKRYKLYDALFYVWTQAIEDFTTILKELIDLAAEDNESTKIFAYLSYTLTGRVYPTGEIMNETKADRAKLDLYYLLFSGLPDTSNASSSSFEYLRKLLDLDAASFMSMLNEAFEDSFLNGPTEMENGALQSPKEEQRFRLSLNRQYLIQVLLQVLAEPQYNLEDVIYLDMFIARSLPKYQQFILLPGTTLQRVLTELCHYPSEELVEDCQLSVEYLLSVYQPPDLLSLIPALTEARFFRVIKTIYLNEKQYALLLQTCLADTENPESIFDCVTNCLRPKSQLSQQQRQDVRNVLEERASEFLGAGLSEAADTIDLYAPDLHNVMLKCLENDEHAQYEYLREVFEPTHERPVVREGRRTFLEQYTKFLCDYDPHHTSKFIEKLQAGDLRLEEVLPALENSSAIDAAVTLMAREGKIRAALDRLIQHLRTLESALVGLIDGMNQSPDATNSREAIDDLVASIERYTLIGIWLCQTQSNASQPLSSPVTKRKAKRHSRLPSEYTQDDLSPSELLWLDLVDAVVQVMRSLTEATETSDASRQKRTASSKQPSTPDTPTPAKMSTGLHAATSSRLRLIVQQTFSALLASTSSPTSSATSPAIIPSTSSATNQHGPKPAFLPILSSFLTRAAATSPSLAHLRAVLTDIFAAYAYEGGLLSLASRLLSKDLFSRVSAVHERRLRGWRPLGMACAGCGRRAWGPGAGKGVWEAWEARVRIEEKRHWFDALDVNAGAQLAVTGSTDTPNDMYVDKYYGKGKGKQPTPYEDPEPRTPATIPPTPSTPGPDTNADAVVVFSCRHLFHRRCLEKAQEDSLNEDDADSDRGREGAAPRARTKEALMGMWRCPLEADGGEDHIES